jgi:magnesium and cobalt exporter, CNNM family
MISIFLPILLILFALAGSAFLSAAEMALLSANRHRLRQRAKVGIAAAQRTRRLLNRREQVLIMFLVGQAALNVLNAAVTTGLVHRWIDRGWLAALISTLGVTVLVVVTAEIVPKVIGKRQSDIFLMRWSRLLELLHYLALPLTQTVQFYMHGMLKLFGGKQNSPFVSRDDLKVLVREAEMQEEGGHQEQRMLESILDFRETVAREIMIPMNQVIALEQGTACDIWRAMVRRHGYTRIPIYKKRIDRVVGVVNIFDLLYDPEPKDTVDEYIRSVPLIPDSKRIDHLLVELQKTRNPLAVVVDEFGACAGIATVEDIVEEIMGEMVDEHEEEKSYRKIREIAPRTYLVEGLTDIDDLNQALGLDLIKSRYDTVGGLVLSRAGRIPREGERFSLQNIVFEVMDGDAYGVQIVKVTLPPEEKA